MPIESNNRQRNVPKSIPAKPQEGKKINNHFIAPRKKGLENMVRDNSRVALDVFERNLAKRKGQVPSKPPKGQRDFMRENMVPKRKLKIGQANKDIIIDNYEPYNRFTDPHLRKYLGRKQKIAKNKKGSIGKFDYFADGSGDAANYPVLGQPGDNLKASGERHRKYRTIESPQSY